MIRTSIRLRLLAWTGALVGLMLIALGVTAYELNRSASLARVDAELERRVSALTQDIRPNPGRARVFDRDPTRTPPPSRRAPGSTGVPDKPPGEENYRPPPRPMERSSVTGPGEPPTSRAPERRTISLARETQALFDESDEDGPFFVIWSRAGRQLNRSANTPDSVTAPPAASGNAGVMYTTDEGYRLAVFRTEMGDCALAGMSLARHEAAMWTYCGWLLATGLLVAAVGAGGGWWIITRALRPIDEISATAQRIAAGNLADRVVVSDPGNELGRLAGVLNQTFARLEAAFAEQRQFTANASHELRTPLAVIISEAQATLARPRREAEYRETLETCLEAAQDMRRLTDSLLELARLDADAGGARHVEVDLAELVDAAVQRIRPLAEERGITLATKLAPVRLRADEARLRQVLLNLVDNAISYNYEQGTVEISTRLEEGQAVLQVTDTGRGIAAEHLPHIFERFYRANAARTSTDRHAGIGLAIVHAIVQAHRGTISVDSKLGLGTIFTVRFPAV